MFKYLQKVGKAFMLPIALLPAAGLLLGIGGAFSSQATIDAYRPVDRQCGSDTRFDLTCLSVYAKSGSANCPPVLQMAHCPHSARYKPAYLSRLLSSDYSAACWGHLNHLQLFVAPEPARDGLYR